MHGRPLLLRGLKKEDKAKDENNSFCLSQGCPQENIVAWLDEISNLAVAKKCAKYWVLLATVAEEHSSVEEILNIYEEAVRLEAQVMNENF